MRSGEVWKDERNGEGAEMQRGTGGVGKEIWVQHKEYRLSFLPDDVQQSLPLESIA